MYTPIHDFLTEYSKSSALRCHMPGDKGLNHPLDITEIKGADSLYEAEGIIAGSEENAARLYGSGGSMLFLRRKYPFYKYNALHGETADTKGYNSSRTLQPQKPYRFLHYAWSEGKMGISRGVFVSGYFS